MLTEAWTQLRPHPLQAAAWRTSKRFVNLPCGRGSGKTEIARRRVVRFLAVKKPWLNPLYFYTLPTYNQAKRVAWKPLQALIPANWVRKIYESDMVIETKFGSELHVLGMDKPHRIEGVQWDGGVCDESCDQKPGSFARSVMPALSHRNAWCWRIGVPKRHGIGAAEFKEVCDIGLLGSDPDVVTYMWPSSDILTNEQLAAAQRLLDAKDYNEQYNASWETVGGSVFHAFSDANITDTCVYDPNKEIIIGSDFNVDPMSWVLCHLDSYGLRVFDELFLRDTNTIKTLDVLHQRYGSHRAGWEFYGDASGRARKTSASTSDYLQIRNDNRFKGRKVYYLRSNPPVADRFAATNALLKNAADERRCHIHPRCKHLIDDLKARRYREGTREPDDYGDIGHMTDALGYIIYRRFPIRLASTGSPSVLVA